MTVARRLAPGQVHAVSHRCSERRFFLKPTRQVTDVIGYTLGLAMERHPGVSLHAYTAQANHVHGLFRDAPDRAQLPELLGLFHSLTARALNAAYGRGENLWCPNSYSNVEVHGLHEVEGYRPNPAGEDGPDALVEQLLYAWVQPVKDGLVERPEDWPGFRTLPEDFGRTLTFARPRNAFYGGLKPKGLRPTDPDALRRLERHERRERQERRRRQRARDRARGRTRRRCRQLAAERERREERERRAEEPYEVRSSLPETVSFTVPPPPGYEDWPIEEVRAHFRRLLDARIEEIHAERRRVGLTEFMGVEAVLRQSPFASAGSTFPRRQLDPRLACKDRERRIQTIADLQDWRAEYREAYLAWRDGHRDVLFPHGTYGLPRFHGARVKGSERSPPALAA